LPGRCSSSERTPNGVPLAKSGKLRALAVAGARRSPLAPELPTIAESGLPGYEMSGLFGTVRAAGTPAAVIAVLNREYVRALHVPEVREPPRGLRLRGRREYARGIRLRMRSESQRLRA